ncbi:ATP-binding protein [Paracoccus marinaquae]|uniref:ATP-binding protein n=1 Tax=Paracoccus marinaquae TaxID=2841926 RepID=A0ABS6AEW7_9RHOB|nr:ATP-binding protein [Paracoccus marinaquae]MBU3029147.1 ATP-binding protein [Paracoccus marinaquae]
MIPTERQNAGPNGRISTRTQPMFHRVLPANPAAVRDTLADIRLRFRSEVSEDTLGRLELVLAEVMNNIAEHAARPSSAGEGAPSIHLSIVRHDGGLACAISDDGVSLPEDCILPRGLPAMDPEDLPEGGFGWYLIQDLTQALCYYREDQRNFLAFRVPFSAEDGAR